MGSGSSHAAHYGAQRAVTEFGHTNPATWNRSYLMAGVRAGLIALVLLALFTMLVLL